MYVIDLMLQCIAPNVITLSCFLTVLNKKSWFMMNNNRILKSSGAYSWFDCQSCHYHHPFYMSINSSSSSSITTGGISTSLPPPNTSQSSSSSRVAPTPDTKQRPVFIYYHIPSDHDDAEHPNAFPLFRHPSNSNDSIRLRDIKQRFPLPGKYHFRLSIYIKISIQII